VNRHALHRELVAAGVPDGYYRIEDAHEPVPVPTDFVFLRRSSDGGWETGVYERGRYEVIGHHTTEAAACTALRRLLG
jgi:hypothetical protein